MPGDPCPFSPGAELAAHNARGFDGFAAARLGWPDIEIDTSELARRAGLPGALDALGTRWLGIPKDKVASAFTKSLSRPSRAKARLGQLPELTPEVLDRVVAYCGSDVEIMAHGWPLLESWQQLEPDVLRVDRAVNDRGIAFDSQLAARLLECDGRLAESALSEAAWDLGMTPDQVEEIARSPLQFTAFTGAPNAQKETVEDLAENEVGEVRAMARARQALASIARGKLEAGLARVSPDGRLRDSMRYYGAHTGRWSHRGLQPGNMPRPAGRFDGWGDAEICRLADRVIAGKHWADAEEIDLLLRACFTASPGNELVVCDFSGVEARALAWCANDTAALEVFASGVSPYKVMGATIFGCSPDEISKGEERYSIGKIAELACGYGMGPPKFEWTANKAGSDLGAIGVDAAEVVYAWRDLHAPIVRFWRALEYTFRDAVRGEAGSLDCFKLVPSNDGRDVAIFLPSGRPIVYSNTRLGSDEQGRPRLAFTGTKGPEHTYGGKLTENAIQALCRDLMADALVRAEDAGLCPVLHVHDEIVCDVPASAAAEAYEYLHAIMTDLPAWAEGFPIGAAGHTGMRYRK